MLPSSVLPPNAPIILDLDASNEHDAIRAVADLLKGHSDVTDHDAFLAAVLERQKINPPLLGNGIALPHARTSVVKEVVFAVARCRQAIPFGEVGAPVRLIFLYGIPPHRVSEHLATTAALARRLRDPAIVESLLKAEDATHFFALLA